MTAEDRVKAVLNEARESTATVPLAAEDETVSIPVREYAALIEDRRQLAELRNASDPRQLALEKVRAFARDRFLKPIRSPIEADQDVALFLVERFGTATLKDILAECRTRFGPGRTPPMSSAHRFWVRIREAVGPKRTSRKGK